MSWHRHGDTLPVARCPFVWSAATRTADLFIERRSIDPARWHDDHRHLTVSQALRRLAAPPTDDLLVVCHGDACAPNTLLAADGSPSRFVDLGNLGVGDRWSDLAIGSWSVGWNYGPGWEQTYFRAYGVEPDPDRIAFYRLLWDLR